MIVSSFSITKVIKYSSEEKLVFLVRIAEKMCHTTSVRNEGEIMPKKWVSSLYESMKACEMLRYLTILA